jgi:hypothetical protein
MMMDHSVPMSYKFFFFWMRINNKYHGDDCIKMYAQCITSIIHHVFVFKLQQQ